MAAGIVHTIISMLRNRNDRCSFSKEKTMKDQKKSKQPTREKLTTIHPSGKKEDSFFTLVYEVVKQIPPGRVTSYGAIAACLGSKLSARMVGWAMNSAHDPSLKIPAHRVVNRNGMLTGKFHFGEPDEMQRRLEKENIKVENDKIVDFKKVFWDPSAL
jgi:methylated-DNA-protein-cysteine methyltransferase-like protein